MSSTAPPPAPQRPTYHQLRAFNAVVKAGSFSRAARALGVSQPAITAQVRSLEDAFGVTLFERGATARPTRLAARLFEATDQLNDLEQVAFDILSASFTLTTGELSIVAGAPHLTMAVVAEYRRRYPGVQLVTSFGNWDQVTTTIYERRADVAILTSGPRDERLVLRRYAKQRLVALVHKSHRLASRKSVSLKDLVGESLIFRTQQSLTQNSLQAAFAAARYELPTPALVLETREAVLECVNAGLGVGFVFSRASGRSDDLKQIPIRDLSQDFWEDVFCLKSQYRRQTVRALFEVVDEISAMEGRASRGLNRPDCRRPNS